jgi:hypothetical protein
MDRSIRTPVAFGHLAAALRSAGYRSSDDLKREASATRYQRDVTIASLVKARRHHRPVRDLKVRVGHLVTALRATGVIA